MNKMIENKGYKLKCKSAKRAVLAFCNNQESGCQACPVREKICHKTLHDCIDYLTEMVELNDTYTCNVLGIEEYEVPNVPLTSSEISLMQRLGAHKVVKVSDQECNVYAKNGGLLAILQSRYFPSLKDVGDKGVD